MNENIKIIKDKNKVIKQSVRSFLFENQSVFKIIANNKKINKQIDDYEKKFIMLNNNNNNDNDYNTIIENEYTRNINMLIDY